MTAVVGINFLSEVIVIADTRVSWPDDLLPPEDILQKLYRIHSPQTPTKAAILGFAGDISAIKIVAQHLGKNKFQNYKRPLVMVSLKNDLRRWIEEVTTTLEPRARAGLRFMLCGIEPSRSLSIKKGNTVIRSKQILETHIYVFQVSSNTGKVKVLKRNDLAVIGSGAQLRRELKSKVLPAIRFGFNQPNLHWGRAHLVGEIANEVFQNAGIKGVGGPLQVGRVTSEGLFLDYIWPRSVESKDVQVSQEGQKTILYNPSLGKRYTLYPIWALPF
jgi:hypothetical protein